MKSLKIKHVTVRGLFGTGRSYKFEFNNEFKIVVGANGDGKSTLLLCIYLALSQQWKRLASIEFDEIEVCSFSKTKTLRSSDLRNIISLIDTGILVPPRFSSRDEGDPNSGKDAFDNLDIVKIVAYYVSRIDTASSALAAKYKDTVEILTGQFSNLSDFQKFISDLDIPLLMYLPTYRRIEKDLKEIIPDLEVRIRRYSNEDEIPHRQGAHFTEIVNFGMKDIERIAFTKMQEAKNYELSRISQLAAEYISGIVSDQHKEMNARQFSKSLTEEEVFKNLQRLQKTEFINYDISSVARNILDIHKKERASNRDKQTAYFYLKIKEAFREVDEKIAPVENFIETVNNYIGPFKRFAFNSTSMSIDLLSEGSNLTMTMLSSGEKQIVSLFAHVYLSDVGNFILLIDEPELSLSVIWQERLINDLVSSGKTAYVAAITHSPFIFEHVDRRCVVDTSEMAV